MGSPSQIYDDYDYIFTGKVTDIKEYYPDSKRVKQISFSIEENFKADIDFSLINVDRPDGMCPIPYLVLNSSYIFYVNKEDGVVNISICNPTLRLEKSKKKLDRYKFYVEELRLIKEAISENEETIVFDNVIKNSISSGRRFARGITKYLDANFKKEDYKSGLGFYLVVFDDTDFKSNHLIIRKSHGDKIDDAIKKYIKSEEFLTYLEKIKVKYKSSENLMLPILIQKPLNDLD